MPELGEKRRGGEINKKDLRHRYIRHACVDCGKERWVALLKGEARYLRCLSCREMGSLHPRWNGGKFLKDGYVLILKPEHPRANNSGYVSRARLVLEVKLGRYLLLGCEPHHKNEIKDDDRPENLEELTHTGHMALHRKGRFKGFTWQKINGKQVWLCPS